MPDVKEIRDDQEAYCSQMHWRRKRHEEDCCCPSLLITGIESAVMRERVWIRGSHEQLCDQYKKKWLIFPLSNRNEKYEHFISSTNDIVQLVSCDSRLAMN